MNYRAHSLLFLACLVLTTPLAARSTNDADTLQLLQRVLNYKSTLSGAADTIRTNVYVRYYLLTEKRNFTLASVPTMHAIARGGTEFAGENFNDILVADGIQLSSVQRINIGTVPHYRNVMTVMTKYLMPDIYGKTLFTNQMLSPFNKNNTKLYKYSIRKTTGNIAEITFRRKRRNTQLVSGSALVDSTTGRITWIHIRGEYDNIVFYIDATMGEEGQYSLFPKSCDIRSTFNCLGNKIAARYHSIYANALAPPDTLRNSHDTALMDSLRPQPLPDDIKALYAQHDSIESLKGTPYEEKTSTTNWSQTLWNSVGEHVVQRTKGSFGTESQGSYRLSPIFNPLFFGYTGHKGFTYKLRFRLRYNFTPNRDILMFIRGGYSFKQRQLYYSVPITFNYNKRKGAYVKVELSNGNRITYKDQNNTAVTTLLDSLGHDTKKMKTFRDFYVKATNNYEFTSHWGGQIGFVYHKRSAVDREGFRLAGLTAKYFSIAPWVELKYRPWGWDGPEFTVEYERGLKLGKADLVYERIELDSRWRRPFNRLRSLSMRLGGGLYTKQGKGANFLDFSNFREESLPASWNDDWSGTFQLLGTSRYNSSKYYVRANVTYESPLMLLSYLPLVGRLMEAERIYANALVMEHMHPYMEYGYGFTTRLFSMGAFIAFRNFSYDGIGCRVAFELFRDW